MQSRCVGVRIGYEYDASYRLLTHLGCVVQYHKVARSFDLPRFP